MKYFLVSEDDTALTGMRLAGIEGQKVSDAAAAEKAVQAAAARDDIAVLLITPKIETMIPETAEKLKISGHRPLLTVIPDSGGKTSAVDSMLNTIREAIGVKL